MHTDENHWRRRKPLAASAAAAIEYMILLPLLPLRWSSSSCYYCRCKRWFEYRNSRYMQGNRSAMVNVEANNSPRIWKTQWTQRDRETERDAHTHTSCWLLRCHEHHRHRHRYNKLQMLFSAKCYPRDCRARQRESCSCSGGMSCRKKSMCSIILCGTPGDLPLRPLLLLLRRFCGLCTRPFSLSHR